MKKSLMFLLCLFLLAGCSANTTTIIDTTSISKADISYSESNATTYDITNGSYTITTPGTYIITGENDNAIITVDVESKGDIKLVLRDVTLTSTNGPAINIVKADNTYLIVEDGTTSTINVSGENDDEEKSGIFSKNDFVIGGSGTLIINSEDDGIKANDNLTIQDTTITLDVGDDGLNVNDELIIIDSIITITSGGDSIKAGNDNTNNAGSVLIQTSTINLASEDDGIDATGDITLIDSTIDILTGEGYENGRHTLNEIDMSFNNMPSNDFNDDIQPNDFDPPARIVPPFTLNVPS